jgi:ATP-dependent RNA helicase DHX33
MLRSPAQSTSNGKSKISTFYSSDEEEATTSALPRNGSKQATQKSKDKQRLKDEALRLKPGRQALPIWEGKDAILEAIAKNDTVIILGETGSGKTTQLPQFLLDSSIPVQSPRIAVTQPRRVAATSLALRVAAEHGCELGKLVGYTVRFSDVSCSMTRLKYMTDGTLLAEMLSDRDLLKYDVVILDEAHERSLRTDMLMGFLKEVQVRRKALVKVWKLNQQKSDAMDVDNKPGPPSELKIVVMSATLDAKRFSEFFSK